MQGSLAVLKATKICVRSPLQEHATVRVIAFDDSVSQKESILNVNVGAMVQQDPDTAGALTDDGQLKWSGPFVAQWIHFSLKLQEEANKRVATIVCSHVKRCPTIIAFCIYNVPTKLRLQHQSSDTRPAMHSSVVKCCEAADEVLHRWVGCEGQKQRDERKGKAG